MDQTDSPTPAVRSSSSSPALIIGLLIIIALGAIYFMRRPSSIPSIANSIAPSATPTTMPLNSPTLAIQPQLTIEGGMYYFKPSEIRAKVGQPLKITLNNVEGMHDLVIDEFKVHTKVIKANESDSIEFTPDKAGTFEYYCSVGQHRQMGMVGRLVVEP